MTPNSASTTELLDPTRTPVTRRDRLGHRLPLAHREPHDRGLVPRAPTRQALYARILAESTTRPTRASLLSQRDRLTYASVCLEYQAIGTGCGRNCP